MPAGPINDLDQVFEDPQVKHRGMRIDPKSDAAKAGSIPGVRTPIMLDGEPMAAENPAPRLGQHTAEILGDLGRLSPSSLLSAPRTDPYVRLSRIRLLP